MKHANPTEFERPRPAGGLRTAAIVIYATLTLLAVTIPQSVVNWLADMNGNPVEETALRGAAAFAEPVAAGRRCDGVPACEGHFHRDFRRGARLGLILRLVLDRKTQKMTVV